MRIVITDGQGFTGAFIRWYTWSEAAHAGIQVADGFIVDATPNHGVSEHDGMRGQVASYYDVQGLTQKIEDRVWDFLEHQIGKPYDWTAIRGMAFHRDWHDDRSWFCSELVAAAFESAGLPLLRTNHLNRVSPRDLLLSPYLSLSHEIEITR